MSIASKKEKTLKKTRKELEKEKELRKEIRKKKNERPKEPDPSVVESILNDMSPELKEAFDKTPSWYIDLFRYLPLIDELNIDVTVEYTGPDNFAIGRKKALVLERQLFLIFECLPKVRSGATSRLHGSDFSKASGISVQTLGLWRKMEWFWGNRGRLMKRIFSMHTPDVIESLYFGSITPTNAFGARDSKCIRLWLEYIEGFNPSIDVTSKGEKIVVNFASGPSNFITETNEEKKNGCALLKSEENSSASSDRDD